MEKAKALNLIVSDTSNKNIVEIIKSFKPFFNQESDKSSHFSKKQFKDHASQDSLKFIKYIQKNTIPLAETINTMWIGVANEQIPDQAFTPHDGLERYIEEEKGIVIAYYYEELWVVFKDHPGVYFFYHDDGYGHKKFDSIKEMIKFCYSADLYHRFNIQPNELTAAYANFNGPKEQPHLFEKISEWCASDFRLQHDHQEILTPFDNLMLRHNSSTFVWVDANLGEHKIENMATSHLYYSIRMVWNYLAPNEFAIDKLVDYDLSNHPTYSDKNLCGGVIKMAIELLKRDDIAPNFKSNIKLMNSNSDWLSKKLKE